MYLVKVTRITPTQSWALELQEFIDHRELLFYFVWRNFKIRYKQTVIGAAWAMLRPLILMIVFTFAFNGVAGVSTGDANIPYPIFAYAGLMFWSYFSQTVVQVGGSLIAFQGVISKIYFQDFLFLFLFQLQGLLIFYFLLLSILS